MDEGRLLSGGNEERAWGSRYSDNSGPGLVNGTPEACYGPHNLCSFQQLHSNYSISLLLWRFLEVIQPSFFAEGLKEFLYYVLFIHFYYLTTSRFNGAFDELFDTLKGRQ